MQFCVKDDSVEAAAAAWVVRLDSGELTAAERSELDAWIAQNPRHAGALVRAQAIWADTDRVVALDVSRSSVQPPQRRWMMRFDWMSSPIARRALIASLAVAIVTSLLAGLAGLRGRETSRFGEIRRITLTDGSNIVLNASSAVQVSLGKDERRVTLLRGEASFNVAHDVQRPFIVQAGNVAVKAIGTSFTVDMHSNSVEVAVVEGVVEVTRPGAAGTEVEVKVLGHNRELVAAATRPMVAVEVTAHELTRHLAWQEGMLEFDGEHLAAAAADVNRYSRTPVVIDSPALAGKTFVGVFRVGDARAFADAAAAAFEAHVIEKDDGFHLTE
ncbi:MAG TPA: FecR domain-containing protein [Steroidobacteraceae bacterium]